MPVWKQNVIGGDPGLSMLSYQKLNIMPHLPTNLKNRNKPFQVFRKPCEKPNNIDCEEQASSLTPFYASGSMTVEAALVLTLLLLSMFSLLTLFSLQRFQLKLQYEMEKELRTAAAGNMSESETRFLIRKAALLAANTSFWNLKLQGTPEIEVSLEKTEETDEPVLCAFVYYQAGPGINFAGIHPKTYVQCAFRRIWSGREKVIGGESEEDASGSSYVYVTQYGTVYHKSRSCSYLNPSCRAVPYASVKELRNEDGGKYKACSYCAGKGAAPDTVYVSVQGEVFHYRRNCLALTRWIRKIRVSEAVGYAPCSRCAGG